MEVNQLLNVFKTFIKIPISILNFVLAIFNLCTINWKTAEINSIISFLENIATTR